MSPISRVRIETPLEAKVLRRPLTLLRLGIRQIEIPKGSFALADSSRSLVESRINDLLSACGCGTGAAFGSITLALWGWTHVTETWPVHSITLRIVCIAVSIILATAMGKAIGRLAALIKITAIADRYLRDARGSESSPNLA